MAGLEQLTFTLDEVEAATGFSAISIRRGCKAGHYKHTWFGKKYAMTREHIAFLIAAHERGGDAAPTADAPEDDELEAARQATAARVTRRGAA